MSKVGIRRDFKGKLAAVRPVGLVEGNGERSDLAGEKSAPALALRQHQSHELRVIGDRLFQVRRFEGCMADPSGFDHGFLLARRRRYPEDACNRSRRRAKRNADARWCLSGTRLKRSEGREPGMTDCLNTTRRTGKCPVSSLQPTSRRMVRAPG